MGQSLQSLVTQKDEIRERLLEALRGILDILNLFIHPRLELALLLQQGHLFELLLDAQCCELGHLLVQLGEPRDILTQVVFVRQRALQTRRVVSQLLPQIRELAVLLCLRRQKTFEDADPGDSSRASS
jgi:hypothetical protein